MSPSTRGYSADRRELTPRMHDVMALAAVGASARQTAAELHITVSTVKTIRAAACARIGAPNLRAAAVLYRTTGEP